MKGKRFVLLALCALCLVAVAIAGAKPGKPLTFSVTIEDKLSDLITDTVISSDGLGPYTNGVDGVTVASSGFIAFWPRADRGFRNVNFKPYVVVDGLRTDLPTPNDYLAPPTGLTGTGLLDPEAGGTGDLAIPLLNMEVGTAHSQCGRFHWVVTDASGSNWRVPNFHGEAANVPESSYVVTTRTSATTWTVESHHQGFVCPDDQNSVGMVLHDVTTTVRGKKTTTTYADGYYYVPFRLTYTLQ